MTINDKNRPWLLVAVGSVLTTLLTATVTVGGEYWLEQRKAKIDLAKDVSRAQASALDKLDRDLIKVQGNVFYMFKLAQTSNSNTELERQAIDTAAVLADMFQDNKPLDDSFGSKNAIHELSESVAPLLADLTANPEKNASRLRLYYPGEFAAKLDAAKASLENDRKRVAPPLQ
ncbi:MAG: hypothetical protein ABR920_01435 [Terriglobales bacterium]